MSFSYISQNFSLLFNFSLMLFLHIKCICSLRYGFSLQIICFEPTVSGTHQMLLLALELRLRGTYMMLGIEPWPARHKANAPPTVLILWTFLLLNLLFSISKHFIDSFTLTLIISDRHFFYYLANLTKR